MTIIAKDLPVQVNLSLFNDPSTVMGFADIAIGSDGKAHIEIVLDEEATQRLGDIAELFDLYSIGFAAIQKKPGAPAKLAPRDPGKPGS